MKYRNSLSLLLVSFLTLALQLGCASGPKLLSEPGARDLSFRASQGRDELTKYRSHSFYKDYEGGQLVQEKEEMVDFTVQSQVKSVDPKNGFVTIEIKTTQKDGLVDLRDLAFPDLGDSIEYVFTPRGEVVRAGDYSTRSVFYVPPISLPKSPVEVGDTWEFSHSWVGSKSGVVTRVEIVSIAKNFFDCGVAGPCAEIEVSGHVKFPALDKNKARFNSELWGRYLYAYERGTVVWSQVHSAEQFLTKAGRKDVWSCMVSYLESPKEEVLKAAQSLECDPQAAAPESIPGT